MKTVQLAIHDSEYAHLLRNLLVRDGMHKVYLVDRPDLEMDGVVVIDDGKFQDLGFPHSDPGRFVVITHKGTDHLSRVWDAGIRHVVFEEEPANTAQLAIIAAELRQPRNSRAGQPGKAIDAHAEQHRASTPPCLPILGPSPRCRKSGPKNAHTGF